MSCCYGSKNTSHLQKNCKYIQEIYFIHDIDNKIAYTCIGCQLRYINAFHLLEVKYDEHEKNKLTTKLPNTVEPKQPRKQLICIR